MSALTKEQARALKRKTSPLDLPECPAPLLVAEPSGVLGFRLRERKVDISSDEGVLAMLADVLVDENGERMFTAEEVPGFLGGLSLSSTNELLSKCYAMYAPAKGEGAPGNSKPSTSAA